MKKGPAVMQPRKSRKRVKAARAGRDFEQWCADHLGKIWPTAEREGRDGITQEGAHIPDLKGLPLTVECKQRKRMLARIMGWLWQAARAAEAATDGKPPMIIEGQRVTPQDGTPGGHPSFSGKYLATVHMGFHDWMERERQLAWYRWAATQKKKTESVALMIARLQIRSGGWPASPSGPADIAQLEQPKWAHGEVAIHDD